MADKATSRNGFAKKKTSSWVKQVVNYNEKRHLEELQEDTQHGVVHTDETDPAVDELEERVNDLGESWETESLFAEILEDLQLKTRVFLDE